MVTSLSEAFVVAGAELGHDLMDVNARSQLGAFVCTHRILCLLWCSEFCYCKP